MFDFSINHTPFMFGGRGFFFNKKYTTIRMDINCVPLLADFFIYSYEGRPISSSLPPVVCKRAHVLLTLFVFDSTQWCPTHIVLCFCFSSSCVPYVVSFFVLCTQCCQFLRLVYPMLPVSSSCVPYVASFFVLCTLCCQSLWTVFFYCPFGIL
jgi:hypothetical protein